MNNYWLPVILLFYYLPTMGSSFHPLSTAEKAPTFKFILVTQPHGLFLPGDEVRFAFFPDTVDQVSADSFTLEVVLPPGLLLNDPFWQYQKNIALRTLPVARGATPYPIDIATKIAPNFKGRMLTVRGQYADFPKDAQSVSISVAEILDSKLDTCFFLQDTTGGKVRSIVATRRAITAKPRGPIDLSPTAPISISHKKCKAFILKPGKKRDKQKENCTALQFTLADTIATTYPARFVPGPKKVEGILPFHSHGNQGDSLDITVRTVKGKPLSGIILTDAKGEILDAQKDAPSYTISTVLDTAVFHQTLHLRARRLLGILPIPRQYCLVDIAHRPAPLTLYRQDGPALQLPTGDANTLLKETVAATDTSTTFKVLSTLRTKQATIFFRTLETVDTTGTLVLRKDTISRDTCAGLFALNFADKLVKKQVWVPIDTLMYQATEDSSTIVGARNLLGIRNGSIEVKVPLKLNVGDPDTQDALIGFSYWIGVGSAPIAQYTSLTAEVPEEWAQPGVSAPLAAYGLGHPVVLPGLPSSEERFREEQVRFDFVGPQGRVAFAAGKSPQPLIRRDPNRPNFGFLDAAALQALSGTTIIDPETGKAALRFFLSFANQHAIKTYRIQLKVIAYYRLSAPQDTWETISKKP